MFFTHFFLYGIYPQGTFEPFFHHCATCGIRCEKIGLVIMRRRNATTAAIILGETIFAVFFIVNGDVRKELPNRGIETAVQHVSDTIFRLAYELMARINISDWRYRQVSAPGGTAG